MKRSVLTRPSRGKARRGGPEKIDRILGRVLAALYVEGVIPVEIAVDLARAGEPNTAKVLMEEGDR